MIEAAPGVGVTLEGRGLHGGAAAAVHLCRIDPSSPVVLAAQGVEAALVAWHSAPAERSTAVAHRGASLRTVEHLFAALAGLGLRRGLRIEVVGPELPILDGTAARWRAALVSLGFVPGTAAPPVVRVVRTGEVVVGRSVYRFREGDAVDLHVDADFGDPRLVSKVAWDGDPSTFGAIGGARTFCFAWEIDELARRGLASHVTPEMVVVIAPDALRGAPPPEPDEPARHKLLDLVGDLYLYGGPPVGRLETYRPGHQATHRAVLEARARGLLALAA